MFNDLVNGCFAEFGRKAMYWPVPAAAVLRDGYRFPIPDGVGDDQLDDSANVPAVPVLVIPRRPDEIRDMLGSQIQMPTSVFDIRFTELAAAGITPEKGNRILFEGDVYAVQSVRREDDERLIWHLAARRL